MEDVFQYIIVVAAVIVAIVSKVRKLNIGNSKTDVNQPVLNPDKRKTAAPIPDNWEKWFESDDTKTASLKQEPVVIAPRSENIHTDSNVRNKITSDKKESQKNTNQFKEENSEYQGEIQLQSIEDVRRAIIYSEIIQRKY